MKKMLKMLMVVAMALTIVVPVLPALAGNVDIGVNNINIGLPQSDPREIASNIIKIVLGFLGLLAVIIILIGGFRWMTAGGNEDSVADAKKILIAGVIGLVIILASWGIASFVLTSLLNAVGG
ncbi:MAG TPA: pilin [Candidatus Methylomirabilis sp.]|nr:pilin [Candidatus Methylomirabilis sp.]